MRIDSLRVGELQTRWITVTATAAAAEWQGQVSSPMALLLAALVGQPSEEAQLRCLERLRPLALQKRFVASSWNHYASS